jgi:hypothetical protein
VTLTRPREPRRKCDRVGDELVDLLGVDHAAGDERGDALYIVAHDYF